MPAPIQLPTRRSNVRTRALFNVAVLTLGVTLPLKAQSDSALPSAEAARYSLFAVDAPAPSYAFHLQPLVPYRTASAAVEDVSAEGSVSPVAAAEAKADDGSRPKRFEIAYNPYKDAAVDIRKDALGSPYIPMDSWMYPALLRLYSLGYIDSAFLAMRPWTRRSVQHMLELSQDDIRAGDKDEALELLDKLEYALRDEPASDGTRARGMVYGADSIYAGARIVAGTVLRDSWHLGQTFNNDYGRPYSNGFNSYDGFSTISELGPFSLHVRGEFQHAPSYQGYSFALASQLAGVDQINYGNVNPAIGPNVYGGVNRPEATIPEGVQPSQNNFRLLEANFAVHAFRHEISFGKSDVWLGPGLGSAMDWSNNAENMYTFRINRVDPLYVPYFSRIFGTLRYDFFVGSLKGHTFPQDDWAHSEMFSLAPTKNFQFSFQRTIIWGGKGHEPITLHTFLKGFFDSNGTTFDEKYGRNDPGARFSSFSFSYRLPFVRDRVMLYTDSTTHDDVFPISAPRRAGWRPGIYFSQLPFVPKLDLRVEGTYTDYVTSRSTFGQGAYYETIQRQAYTNKGFLLGDWIGREAKGGQAWLTYHLSGNESVTFQYLRKKNAKDFIEGGTTQNIYRVDLIKRINHDVEVSAWFQAERWKAPIWMPGQQSSTTGAFQVTWFPALRTGSR